MRKNKIHETKHSFQKKFNDKSVLKLVLSNFIIFIILFSAISPFTVYEKKQKNNNNEMLQNISDDNIKQNIPRMNRFFVKNKGQINNDNIFFTFSDYDKNFAFLESCILINIIKIRDDTVEGSSEIKLTFENSNKIIPKGLDKLNHKSNYFIGNDMSKWSSNISNYDKIIYENLYEGIDLVYYFNEMGLKYDWIVKTDADPKIIVEKYEGIEILEIDIKGDLNIITKSGELHEGKPLSYQEIGNKIVRVDVVYDIINENSIKYCIGKYDYSKELIIDPLIYSTYIGGGENDEGIDIKLDNDNNILITGKTYSSNFPFTNGSYSGYESDIILFKIDSTDYELVFSTIIGGNDVDNGNGLAIDFENNIYITGYTKSSNFPVTNDCYDNDSNGDYDIFVIKIKSDSLSLIYSTYIGHNDVDKAYDIEVDNEQNSYITGYSWSNDFPTTNGSYQKSKNYYCDIFIFKLNKNGTDCIYSTFIGGNGWDSSWKIVLDDEKNAIITGNTNSDIDLPLSNAYDAGFNGGIKDIFLCKLNFDGSIIIFSTYIGGSNEDYASDITLDIYGDIYLTGATGSYSDFPLSSNCYDYSYNGGIRDVFMIKMKSDGSDLIYSTYIGGDSEEWGAAITIDDKNNIYIAGPTKSSNFPITPNCYQNKTSGNFDVFLCKLNITYSEFLYSTYIGGTEIEYGRNLILDSNLNIYITGFTKSLDFKISNDSFDDSHNGMSDIFFLKFMINSIPKVSNIKILPDNPLTTRDIEVIYEYYDDEGVSENKTIYKWYKNEGFGFNYTGLNEKKISNNYTKKGEVWICEVTPCDGENFGITANSTEVIIINTPPDIKNITNEPLKPITVEDIKITYDFNDDDNDTEFGTTYNWYKDSGNGFKNVGITSKILSSKYTTKHEKWQCKVTPKDGSEFGEIKSSEIIEILNSQPVAMITSPKTSIFYEEAKDILFDGSNSYDNDKDILSYKWFYNSNLLSNEKTFLNKFSEGNYSITLFVDDNDGFADTKIINITIIKANQEYSDFCIYYEDIKFDRIPEVGIMSNITIKIYNHGYIKGMASISIYDGKPLEENIIITYEKIVIPSLKSYYATAGWKPRFEGNSTIYVVIKNCEPSDLDYENNQASKTVVVINSKKLGANNPGLVTPAVASTIAIFLTAFFLTLSTTTDCGRYRMMVSIFLPLYHKLTRDVILQRLNNDKFKVGQIYQTIKLNPGITFSEIKRSTGLKNGSTAYHLNRLEKERIINSVRDGLFRRFYLSNIKISEVPTRLTQIQHRILGQIYENPGIEINELSKKLSISRQNLTYHLRILKNSNPPYIKYLKIGLHNNLYLNIEYDNKSMIKDDF